MTDAVEPPLLEIDEVSVRRQREAILDRISLRIRRSTVHALAGPNGAGKTTLISAILGLIEFDGRIVARWRGTGTIGYVPQNFTVDPTLPVTVQDFLALTRQRRPVCLGIEHRTRVHVSGLLAQVGLQALERRPLAVLSGGELRRVLLAHALDPIPELLILDEPGGLDESAARLLEQLLTSVTRTHGTTVLLVSHDFEQVRRIADYVTVMNRRVVAEGRAADVLAAEQLLAHLPPGERQTRP